MEEKVISLIAAVLNVDVSKIKMDTEIGELDEWDSLRNVAIIARLEREFEIKITPEMIVDLEDVSDIASLVKDLKEQS
jgi:acyl carrier protein